MLTNHPHIKTRVTYHQIHLLKSHIFFVTFPVALDYISGLMCCTCHPILSCKPWGCYRFSIFTLFPFLIPLSPFISISLYFLYYTSGKHLAEHCKNEYEKGTNYILWILAEISIVACDIPEGITTIFIYCFYLLNNFQT